MVNPNRLFSLLWGLAMFLFISCGENEPADFGFEYGIFTVSEDGFSASVEGEIVDESIEDFRDMLDDHQDIETLLLVYVPGSDVSGDQETDQALELGRAVYDSGLNLHLVDNGLVASGGTDLLVSGRTVSIGENTMVGVHAWDGGWDGNPEGTAWDIRNDENHPEHQKYLRYFEDIGFSSEKAAKFYFFTIRVAKAEEMHYMNEDEIGQYLLR